MVPSYLTIAQTGYSEVVEKKSRFLGGAYSISGEEEISAIVTSIRKEHYDARHSCYAWVMEPDGSKKKASDDGEPQGTAGLPILKVIEGMQITNALVVVTRYFGGTLLGTGGLVRAYTEAAKEAILQAKLVKMCSCTKVAVTVEYPLLDSLSFLLKKEGIKPDDILYTDKVCFLLTIEDEQYEQIHEKIVALTASRLLWEEKEKGFFAIDNSGAL